MEQSFQHLLQEQLDNYMQKRKGKEKNNILHSYKNSFKMDHRGENLDDLGYGDDFLDMPSKP